jgi:hypothetical protein
MNRRTFFCGLAEIVSMPLIAEAASCDEGNDQQAGGRRIALQSAASCLPWWEAAAASQRGSRRTVGVAVLAEPAEIPNLGDFWHVLENGARSIGVQLQMLAVRGPDDFARAFNDT